MNKKEMRQLPPIVIYTISQINIFSKSRTVIFLFDSVRVYVYSSPNTLNNEKYSPSVIAVPPPPPFQGSNTPDIIIHKSF